MILSLAFAFMASQANSWICCPQLPSTRGKTGRTAHVFAAQGGTHQAIGPQCRPKVGVAVGWPSPPQNQKRSLNGISVLLQKRALAARIARPESLAIWHHTHSHRRPDGNESPKRRHFASLNVKQHVRRPTSQDFRGSFLGQYHY